MSLVTIVSLRERDTHCFYQVIVWDLRKEMMNHMSSDIMMDVVDPSVVAIKSGQSSPQVTPFLNNQKSS